MFDNRDKAWNEDLEAEQALFKGRTGLPIVDACVTELISTGYLSNRGR